MFQEFSLKTINGLSSSELEAFKYINSHKKEVIEMSIHDLAKTVFVSTATISRVNRCLHYGTDGYKLAIDRVKAKKENKE